MGRFRVLLFVNKRIDSREERAEAKKQNNKCSQEIGVGVTKESVVDTFAFFLPLLFSRVFVLFFY